MYWACACIYKPCPQLGRFTLIITPLNVSWILILSAANYYFTFYIYFIKMPIHWKCCYSFIIKCVSECCTCPYVYLNAFISFIFETQMKCIYLILKIILNMTCSLLWNLYVFYFIIHEYTLYTLFALLRCFLMVLKFVQITKIFKSCI